MRRVVVGHVIFLLNIGKVCYPSRRRFSYGRRYWTLVCRAIKEGAPCFGTGVGGDGLDRTWRRRRGGMEGTNYCM